MEATQSESRSYSAACTVLRRDSCTGRGTDGLGKDLHNARVRLRESHNPLLPCRNSASEGCQCGSLHPRAGTNRIAEQGVGDSRGRRIPPTMSRILHLRYVDHSQLTAQDIPVHSYLGLFSHSRS